MTEGCVGQAKTREPWEVVRLRKKMAVLSRMKNGRSGHRERKENEHSADSQSDCQGLGLRHWSGLKDGSTRATWLR